MSFDSSKFLAASEAAESWLTTLAFVGEWGRQPEDTGAAFLVFRLLTPEAKDLGPNYKRVPQLTWPQATPSSNLTLRDSYREHTDLLEQLKSRPAHKHVTTGQVLWPHGLGGRPVAWSRAHEAAAGLVLLAMKLLVGPLATFEDATERNTAAQRLVATRSQSVALSWEQVVDLQERIRRERTNLLALLAPNDKPPAKRKTGRPRKGESSKERLVISALVKHHKWQSGGSVENYTPAKTKQLADLASGKNVKVSVATVSRFFKRKFPDHDKGYDGYVAACNQDARVNIGMHLDLWQGEVSKQLADLLPHETGPEKTTNQSPSC